MNNREISEFASSFANQLEAGIPITEIVKLMQKIQPKYEDYWSKVYTKLSNGSRLSVALKEGSETPVFSNALMSAISVGEDTGSLDKVFKRIDEAITVQQEVNNLLKGLYTPIGLVIAAIGVFFFFMVSVIPSMVESMGSRASKMDSWVTSLSGFMTMVWTDYWHVVLVVFLSTVVLLFNHFSEPENRMKFMGSASKFPIVGESIRDLQYGVWGSYLSIMYSAGGISITEQLKMSKKVLPDLLQAPINLIEDEIISKGMSQSVNLDRLDQDDPRQNLPIYIVNAFVVGDRTGALDVQLDRNCSILIRAGKKKLTANIASLNNIAKGFAGVVILSPMVGYFAQVGQMVQG